MATDVTALLSEIASAPSLPGARCKGSAGLFDPKRDDERPADVDHRHRAALDVCARCRCLDACQSWLASLGDDQRPHGVVAGIVVNPPPRRRPAVPGVPVLPPAERLARVVALRDEGLSHRDIAARLGISQPTVSRDLLKVAALAG